MIKKYWIIILVTFSISCNNTKEYFLKEIDFDSGLIELLYEDLVKDKLWICSNKISIFTLSLNDIKEKIYLSSDNDCEPKRFSITVLINADTIFNRRYCEKSQTNLYEFLNKCYKTELKTEYFENIESLQKRIGKLYHDRFVKVEWFPLHYLHTFQEGGDTSSIDPAAKELKIVYRVLY
ncbi:MAG: hypothetical protein IIA88_08845 [Bacteroidetes bacterium]|nr:hypothetical protein [Bacteroidota bacterium]